MKKLLICMTVLASLLTGATALASEYDDTANKLTVAEASGAAAVIVAKNTGRAMTAEDIVYADQNSEGFSDTEFLLKTDLEPGFYTVILRSVAGDTKTAKFFVGTLDDFTKTELKMLPGYELESDQGDGQYVTRAYVSDGPVELGSVKTVVVAAGNRVVYSKVETELSGEGEAMLGVKLSGIPASDKENITVYVSADEVVDSDLITE